MKKIKLLIIIVFMMVLLSSCAADSPQSENESIYGNLKYDFPFISYRFVVFNRNESSA